MNQRTMASCNSFVSTSGIFAVSSGWGFMAAFSVYAASQAAGNSTGAPVVRGFKVDGDEGGQGGKS